MPVTIALVVAAGRGARFGGELPKQYAALGGKPVLRWSLEAFARHARIDAVRAVTHADDADRYAAAAAGLGLAAPVTGGATRQESVRCGLEALVADAPARVLIHDGARPFVDAGTIDAVLDALEAHQAAIPALAVADTLKESADGALVSATRARDRLWRAQTPQGFRFDAILAAHRAAAGAELTDDAAIAERAGLAVALVPGRETNFKLTTADDLARAAAWLSGASETRAGSGFDVHRFGSGDHVMLCGVRVPHARGLVGHSDADVGLHALTDALLGALADGDIGAHFPPSDPRWRGADSATFLADAAARVRARGGAIVHVDVTLICEAPKIAAHRETMRARLAAILGIDVGRCAVKATTTEGLGFTGRGEGIAAQATATIRLQAGPP